jgi:hypothetical protein
VTQLATTTSPKKNQTKTQRTKFADAKHQQPNALIVCFWSNKRMAFTIIELIGLSLGTSGKELNYLYVKL